MTEQAKQPGHEDVTLRVTTVEGNVTEHTVEGRPLTIITHQGAMEVDAVDSDIVTITANDTVSLAESLTIEEWLSLRLTPEFCCLFKQVFNFNPPVLLLTTDTKHVVGLILHIANAFAAGKRPFLKFPETHLHPAQHAALASMLSGLTGKK